MNSDRKTTIPNNHPCRQCGVGHHRNGKCDMCSVSTEGDEQNHQKWLARQKRQKENADTVRKSNG